LASGVSVDLAPVLDVDGRRVLPGATDPDGLRSFGGTESVVAADGAAFSAGLIAAGTIPVVKHFPGLGSSSGNSDNGPSATLPWPTLKATALHPFEVAIANGAPAVMVANAHVPGLTPLPASLSPRVLRGVLRQMLGFKGLIVTDSLTAGAISAAHLSPEAASAAAIENGADLVLLGAQTSVAKDIVLADRTSNAVVLAVQHGSLARATLQDAVAHILNAKALLHC
jgi:beta-N-acetylhexosaminidase